MTSAPHCTVPNCKVPSSTDVWLAAHAVAAVPTNRPARPLRQARRPARLSFTFTAFSSVRSVSAHQFGIDAPWAQCGDRRRPLNGPLPILFGPSRHPRLDEGDDRPDVGLRQLSLNAGIA